MRITIRPTKTTPATLCGALCAALALPLIGCLPVVDSLRDVFAQKKLAQTAFTRFADHLVKADYEDAYQMGVQEFRSKVSFDVFRSQQTLLVSLHGRLKSVHQGGTVVDGKGSPARWEATIHADLIYENDPVPFVFKFRYEEGRWGLYGYKEL